MQAAARNDTQTHDLLGGRLLRWASYATLDSLSESHELGGEVSGLTSAGVAVIHTCLDVVATELFIIGLEYLRRRVRSSELVAGKGRGVVTLAPFSVVVEGLPRDIDDVDEIEDYFSRFGDVADVVLSTVRLLPHWFAHPQKIDVSACTDGDPAADAGRPARCCGERAGGFQSRGGQIGRLGARQAPAAAS